MGFQTKFSMYMNSFLFGLPAAVELFSFVYVITKGLAFIQFILVQIIPARRLRAAIPNLIDIIVGDLAAWNDVLNNFDWLVTNFRLRIFEADFN